MLKLEEAKKLSYGEVLYCKYSRNADGSPERWRVNGKVKLWKRNPNRIQIPLKHGLYDYGYLTERDLNAFSLSEEEAVEAMK